MFFHIYKFRLKSMIHQKEEFFWTLIFPILLGTLFFAAFSDISNKTESFHSIPVAVVAEDTSEAPYFTELLDNLSSAEGEEIPFFNINYCDEEEAIKLLEQKDIQGIILMKEGKPTLQIRDNGINETMIKSVIDKYLQTMDVVENMPPEQMGNMEQVITVLTGETALIEKQKLTDGNIDNVMDYFYALIAMTCLMGTTAGQLCAMHIKANLSEIGFRKTVSSAKRSYLIIGDLLATITNLALANALLIAYLKYILKINLGAGYFQLLFISLLGSLIAISIGMLVGSIPKISNGAKVCINIGITLFSSFLSGLMAGGIKNMIEEHCPIINRLNPASLISDAIYSLNIYDNYDKYMKSVVIMITMSVVLLAVSIVIARRESYDSI